MQRRKFLKSATLGLAAAPLAAAPAIAQSMPEVRWRCATSWPKSLDALYGAPDEVAARVAAATDGRFQIRVFAGGEIVPALGVLDAVQSATVECGHTASYYYFGKDPTFAFDTTVPFGLNARQMNAWMYQGGGLDVMRGFFKTFNIRTIPCGNTGAQMGGWFRKEINTAADLQGLKFRIGGFAGQTVARLGVVPQQIAGADVYPSLEKGIIDAAEWVGPYDDERLGFQKVARYYYYPGWWEGEAQLTFYANIAEWEKLPKSYQAILEAACAEAHASMLAKYDARNMAALRRLIAGGAQLRPFSREILDACWNAANAVYDETAAKNPAFKKVWDAYRPFRDELGIWFSIAEATFDNFMLAKIAQSRR
jgi:TRAP-type mannitol/chloroaromatic compound transport system substrate-binding protein